MKTLHYLFPHNDPINLPHNTSYLQGMTHIPSAHLSLVICYYKFMFLEFLEGTELSLSPGSEHYFPTSTFLQAPGDLCTSDLSMVLHFRHFMRDLNVPGTGSIHRLRDHEEWPDPPASTEDEAMSPFSDTYCDSSLTNDNEECSYLHPGISGKNMTPNGTYVIRKGRRKERKALECVIQPPEIIECDQQRRLGDLKRCSSTFDNIKSLLKEGLLEGLDEPPPDFSPPTPPALVRVVSLPSLASEDSQHREFLNGLRHHGREDAANRSKNDVRRLSRPHELAVTMEEEEDASYCFNPDDKDLTESDVNEEERRLIEQLEKQQLSTSSESLPMADRLLSQEYPLNESITDGKLICHLKIKSYDCRESENDEHHRNRNSNSSCDDEPKETATQNSKGRKRSRGKQKQEQATALELDAQWSAASEMNTDVHTVPVVLMDERTGPPNADAESVTVDMLQHEFPPLPPSPVEEDDDEYSEILNPSPAQTPKEKADTLPEPFYRSLEPPGSDPCGMRFLNRPCPPEPPPHQEPMSSLKTRSMDAGFSRGYHNHNSSSRREVSIMCNHVCINTTTSLQITVLKHI